MFKVDIDGKTVDAEVSFLTLQLYEAEFRADIIQDFFGVQDGKAPVTYDENDESIVKIDFTKIAWSSITKALWAACKTANPSTASYSSWMKKTKGVNMWLVREQLAEEISDCFFRTGAAKEGAQGAEG